MKKNFLFHLSFLLTIFCSAENKLFLDLDSQSLLDNLATQYKTDKSSQHHSYTKIYDFYFRNIRLKPLKFLEIGIFCGSSVMMWENYLENSELHFIDITYENLVYNPIRSHLHLVDQSNASSLMRFIEEVGGNFDVILDDGGHTMDQQITSFKTLFPFVKSGGVYIIEDLHTSYWGPYGGNPKGAGKKNTVGLLKNLIDDVNYIGNITRAANHERDLGNLKMNDYQKDILSIQFYDSLCFIFKR